MLGQDRFQQARKTVTQVFPAQRIHVGRADGLGLNQAGITQHPKMMGHGGLRAATVQVAAAGLSQLGEAPDNLQAYRVAQGVKQTLKNEFAERKVFEGAHERIIHGFALGQ